MHWELRCADVAPGGNPFDIALVQQSIIDAVQQDVAVDRSRRDEISARFDAVLTRAGLSLRDGADLLARGAASLAGAIDRLARRR